MESKQRYPLSLTNFLRGVITNVDKDDIDQASLGGASRDAIPSPLGALRPRPATLPVRALSSVESIREISFDSGEKYLLAVEASGSDRVLRLIENTNDDYVDADSLTFTESPASIASPDLFTALNSVRLSLGDALGDANHWLGKISDDGRLGDASDAYDGLVLEKAIPSVPAIEGAINSRPIFQRSGDSATVIPADGESFNGNPFYPVTSYKLSIVTDDGQEFFDSAAFTVTDADYWNTATNQPTYYGHRVLALTLAASLLGRRIVTIRLWRARGIDTAAADFSLSNYHLLQEIDAREGAVTATLALTGRLSNRGATLSLGSNSITPAGAGMAFAWKNPSISIKHPLFMFNYDAKVEAERDRNVGVAWSTPDPFNGDGLTLISHSNLPFDQDNENIPGAGYVRNWRNFLMPGAYQDYMLLFREPNSDGIMSTNKCGMEKLSTSPLSISGAIALPWLGDYAQQKNHLMQFGLGYRPMPDGSGNWWNQAASDMPDKSWVFFEPGLGSQSNEWATDGQYYVDRNAAIEAAAARILVDDWIILPFTASNGITYYTIHKILEVDTVVTDSPESHKMLALRVDDMGVEYGSSGRYLASECPVLGTYFTKTIDGATRRFSGFGNHVLMIVHDESNLSNPGVTRSLGAKEMDAGQVTYRSLRGLVDLVSGDTPVPQALRGASLDIASFELDYDVADNWPGVIVLEDHLPDIPDSPYEATTGSMAMHADTLQGWSSNGDGTYVQTIVDDNRAIESGLALPAARKRPIVIGWRQGLYLNGRAFYFGPTTVEDGFLPDAIYYSERNQPDVIAGVNVMTVEAGDNDSLVGGVAFRGRLMVFKRDSWYLVRVVDIGEELDWQVEDEGTESGCNNKHSHIVAKNTVYWISSDQRIFGYNGTDPVEISKPIGDQLKDLDFSGSRIGRYNQRYLLFSLPAEQRVFVYDLDSSAWVPEWSLEMTDFIRDSEYYLDSTGVVKLVESHTLSVDEFALIEHAPTMILETQDLHAKQPGLKKKWRRLNLLITDQFDVDVSCDQGAYERIGTYSGDGKTPIEIRLNRTAYTIKIKLTSRGPSGDDNGNANTCIAHGLTLTYEFKRVK